MNARALTRRAVLAGSLAASALVGLPRLASTGPAVALDASLGVVVTDVGALGDGVADDGPAIDRAFALVSASGGRVWFPTGTYRITSTLSVPPGVVLTGMSSTASLIVPDASVGGAAITFEATTKPGTDVRGGIEHLGVDGPGEGVVNSVGVCIQETSRCLLQDVLVTGTEQAFRIDGGQTFAASNTLVAVVASNVRFGLYVTAGSGGVVTDLHLAGAYFWGSRPIVTGGAGFFADAMHSSQLHSLSVEGFDRGVFLTGQTQSNSFLGTRAERSGVGDGTRAFVVSGPAAVQNTFVTPCDADVVRTQVAYLNGASGNVYPL